MGNGCRQLQATIVRDEIADAIERNDVEDIKSWAKIVEMRQTAVRQEAILWRSQLEILEQAIEILEDRDGSDKGVDSEFVNRDVGESATGIGKV